MNGLMGRVAAITGGTGALGRVVGETFLRAEANERKKRGSGFQSLFKVCGRWCSTWSRKESSKSD
jgi:hypothetical protein